MDTNSNENKEQNKRMGGIQKEQMHEGCSAKKIIGIVSGKGGVGKSMVTSLIAEELAKSGARVGILDADVTGPSIPKIFGVHGHAIGSEEGIFPMESEHGIEIMSVNLMLKKEDDPVAWRGPVIAGVIKQFFTDVLWGDLDYLLIDMPPGTGDVPLTVFQSIPLTGIVIVTSPQDLVSMIVRKARNLAKLMKIPVLGIIENYSYMVCPDCGKKIEVFGKSSIEAQAEENELPILGKLPIMPELAELADEGRIDEADTSCIKETVEFIKEN